jgi:predicted alpha/beta-hydrolase family hydrolase
VSAEPLTIEVGRERRVCGLLSMPASPRACLVLAHGAGAGMRHPFLEATAAGACARGIANLRYQFPYMEQGARRPDPPALAQAAVRAAVEAARRRLPALPLVAGGKSFGGRMTSQAQAARPMPELRGIVFFGFPLHPAGRPSQERAAHLNGVRLPMLFLQGTRDALADAGLMRQVADGLGPCASLTFLAEADHSFHVPARSGRTDREILGELLDRFEAWLDGVILGARRG